MDDQIGIMNRRVYTHGWSVTVITTPEVSFSLSVKHTEKDAGYLSTMVPANHQPQDQGQDRVKTTREGTQVEQAQW